jgi:large subunit ribosomal protein L13
MASQAVQQEKKEKSAGKSTSATRFLGWQKTPASQATFGRTTRGGRKNTRFTIKHSTGSVNSVEPRWYLVDASTAPVGHLATVIATLLMGKHRTTFTPGAGSGDGVVVINADKAFFTYNKADKKVYYDHSGWMGGLKSKTARQALKDEPDAVIWDAVQGMMPKNKLSRYQLAHLKVYRTAEHDMKAQNPVAVDVAGKSLKNLGV